jgi:uncharacterized protein DUF3800
VLQAGLDDSGKDGISPAFVLAGYIGSADKMMDLADAWDALLAEKPKLDYIKGYEAFGLHHQFDGWSVEQRDERLLKFVRLIAEHSGKGIAFVIDQKPFALIKELRDDEGVSFKDPYEFAYASSLSTLLQVLPDFGEDVIDAVFDCNLISRRQAAKAYKRIFSDWPDLAQRLFRKEPHWENDRQFLPLQAADLIAYCVRAIRDPDKRHDRVRNSPVLAALRSIPTVLAYAGNEKMQYLRDRIKKKIARQEIFTATKW